MWTYIIRRLLVMIPTLFGVTIVAFIIMQIAPGDPLKAQLGAAGTVSESSQTREAYIIMRRELKLDKPLVLNFRYFFDYGPEVRAAAHYRALTADQIAEELPALAAFARGDQPPEADRADDPAPPADRLDLLRDLDIENFDRLLQSPDSYDSLATKIETAVQIYLEETGPHGVPPAIGLLRRGEGTEGDRRSEVNRRLWVGAIRALNLMVVDPFRYTYSREPESSETPEVTTAWRLWWDRAEPDFPELDPRRRRFVEERFAQMIDTESRSEVFRLLESFDRADMRYFIGVLLDEESSLREKSLAAATLNLYVANPLRLDVPRDASDRAVAEARENWLAQYELNRGSYEPGLGAKLGALLTNTQYAHMVWRLVTFNFGRSATKTREPVGEKILDAVLVSAPLMIMAQIVIYLVAVPLGIVCAVNRANTIDRSISLGLFMLYSIPPFIAGMLLLQFFCYGVFWNWFPSLGLHSPGAERMAFGPWLADYLWHAFLPVVCLSLFSLAAMAMYSRTSMLEVIGQDYIRTARAKGLSERKVILKHGFRNALIPIITLFAGFLPAMLGGSVLIEYLFGIPGMGRLSWNSIQQRDFPTLMALIYIDAIVVMLSILATDLLYVFVDPRISFEKQGAK